MTRGTTPGGPQPGGPTPGPPPDRPPKPPDPKTCSLTELADYLMTTPLITEAPPLSDAQRDRLAVIFGACREELLTTST